ncbi:AbrB/MazE/SpoVT family DNA-binding domain-containing protein [Endothiovibrio diazotrophicus]
MDTVRLSTKGQIVIPKELRESHHLFAGTEFAIQVVGGEIRLRPIPAFPPIDVNDGKGLLSRSARHRLSDNEAEEAIGRMLADADEATKG